MNRRIPLYPEIFFIFTALRRACGPGMCYHDTDSMKTQYILILRNTFRVSARQRMPLGQRWETVCPRLALGMAAPGVSIVLRLPLY